MEREAVCGIDEAGRGPLAGPVLAGAVILPPDFPVGALNDSKKLSETKRFSLEALIRREACWGLGFVGHTEIDRINILQASLLAMKYAFADMAAKIASDSVPRGGFLGGARNVRCRVVVDGLFCPDLGKSVAECGSVATSCEARVKADASCPEVMAASILAKCARDRLMAHYGALYPAYGYERHKGYPTKAHREACKQLGPSPIQRLTFTVR